LFRSDVAPMTHLLSTPYDSIAVRPDFGGALVSIRGIVRDAHAALAADDRTIGIPECLRLLRQLDHVLDAVAVAFADDGRAWSAVRSLRDELGGYLLATETLRDVGVNTEAVVALLQRGVALADSTL
jgi:hypothetical protein